MRYETELQRIKDIETMGKEELKAVLEELKEVLEGLDEMLVEVEKVKRLVENRLKEIED